jgi:hypothetical protein
MDHGLTDSKVISAAEKLAMFLFIIGGNNSYRDTELQFCHSPSTIQKYFHRVLRIIVRRIYPVYVQMPKLETPPNIKDDPKYYPWFQHCVGALDGSHIAIAPPKGMTGADHIPFRNRKAGVSQNVLAAVDFNMNFVFVLAGWEGSANDQKVLNDAVSRGAFSLPTPWYFLADAGYSFNSGLTMPPYKNVRYHLQEWMHAVSANQLPRNPRELFNRRHSSLRNVVERVFGVLKNRFQILNYARKGFSIETQVDIVYACIALHNFINATGGNASAEADELDDDQNSPNNDNNDISEEEVEEVSKERRDEIAKAMYENWTVYKLRRQIP